MKKIFHKNNITNFLKLATIFLILNSNIIKCQQNTSQSFVYADPNYKHTQLWSVSAVAENGSSGSPIQRNNQIQITDTFTQTQLKTNLWFSTGVSDNSSSQNNPSNNIQSIAQQNLNQNIYNNSNIISSQYPQQINVNQPNNTSIANNQTYILQQQQQQQDSININQLRQQNP